MWARAQVIREVLMPLKIEGRRSARHGDVVALPGGDAVGRVTSGSSAPSLGYVIAFAWVDAAHADKENFVVRAARTELPAAKVDIPFYKEGTARKNYSNACEAASGPHGRTPLAGLNL